MQIALVLYDRFTALDLVGPFQVVADLPDIEVVLVADRVGPIADHTALMRIESTATFDSVRSPDVVIVPGGRPDREVADPLVAWLRTVAPGATWMTSVCTGSILLAEAGLLRGLTATTHWSDVDELAALGATPVTDRVVKHPGTITAAGVSSGIDMALTLVAELYDDDVARAVQLAIEYDPEPPFDAGSPAKAGPELTALVSEVLAAANA